MPASDENQKRMEAFLVLFRYAEHGKHDRSDAYTSLYGGGQFGGFSDHPRKSVNRWHHRSNAAGAYQIDAKTYDDAVKQHHVAHDFSPHSQDAIAVWIVTKEAAQWDIWDGKLDSVFMKLNHRWPSLPGGGQQELTSDEAKKYSGTVWEKLRHEVGIDARVPDRVLLAADSLCTKPGCRITQGKPDLRRDALFRKKRIHRISACITGDDGAYRIYQACCTRGSQTNPNIVSFRTGSRQRARFPRVRMAMQKNSDRTRPGIMV